MNINSDISSINKILGTYQTTKVQKPDNKNAVSPVKTSENTALNDIEDRVEISQESKDLLEQEKVTQSKNIETEKTTDTNSSKELTDQEKKNLEELKKTDREVKAHEQAHMSAASGIVTGAPQYNYEKGPDGKNYAVSGEVDIRVSEEQDPEETIKKAEQVKKAALAPAEPSDQDRRVAQQADQMIQNAKAEEQNSQGNTGIQENPNTSVESDKKESTSESPGVLVDVFG